MAETSSTLTFSSMARNARKRAVSSTPAWPKTRCGGKPVTCQALCTMASSGLLTTITIASGLLLADLRGDGPHDPGVGGQKIVAAHARLAGNAGRDHHDVAAGRVVVVGRAGDAGVKTHDRAGLEKIERLALGHVLGLGNIQEHDVAQFGSRTPMRGGRPDVACPDDRDLRAFHCGLLYV